MRDGFILDDEDPLDLKDAIESLSHPTLKTEAAIIKRQREQQEKFSKHLDWCSKVVASWPEWKRNIL